MIAVPEFANLSFIEWFIISAHILISLAMVIFLAVRFVQNHGGFIPTAECYDDENCITKQDRFNLFTAIFALIHITFLATYIFGINVGIILEINLLIIFIFTLKNFNKNSFVPYANVAFLSLSFIFISGPLEKLLFA